MTNFIDSLLDRITMYRLTLYALVGLLGCATIAAAFSLLPFSPLALFVSAAFLVMMCWATNTLLAHLLAVPTNVESAYITALILALILDPARTADDFQFLGWAAILAMASKYVLALNRKHLFNPAAVAVAITAVTLHETASWWVATACMLPFTIIGGMLIVRKLRYGSMVATFLATGLLVELTLSVLQRANLQGNLQQLALQSPLFFIGALMLTEPLTAPPTRAWRMLYGALVGMLLVPQVHVGGLYFTPEVALVIGNTFSYLVGPKARVVLRVQRKLRLAPNIVDFILAPSRQLSFVPGQYMEFTLAHAHPDARGNRRYFTLASSPTEDQIHLGVRFSADGSSYKEALYVLDGRHALVAGQVAGDFTLPAGASRKLAFLAGGIGITPFRSMLKYLLDTRQRRDIVVIYANRTVSDFVYRDVLGEAQARLGIRIIYTLTDTAAVPSNWPGATGRIDRRMIESTIPDYRERTFYLSGPPDMVRAHARVLLALGVARTQIKRDYFTGLA